MGQGPGRIITIEEPNKNGRKRVKKIMESDNCSKTASVV
jgi:hypothetical protein